MTNTEIADILRNIGLLLELKGENPFKIRAYQNAARALDTLSVPVAQLVDQGTLASVDGLGKALVEKITTLVETGTLPVYTDLKAEFPDDIFDLLSLNGLGPKKARVLYQKLKISSLKQLKKACESGEIAKLEGFGIRTAEKFLESIRQKQSYRGRFRYAKVMEQAENLVALFRTHPDVIRISIAGSLRRGREIVKDIDLIASSANPKQLMQDFVHMDEAQSVTSHGDTKSSIRIANGLQVDLRVVGDGAFPCALHHFTGSREHNVALRRRAKEQNLKISEWGLFDTSGTSESLIPCRDESELYSHLDLDYIPPELREDTGEIEAAATHQLPRLIEWTDLHGCFHNHTTASDGKNTLEEMAEAAASIGLDYLGIADHSKSSIQANGLSPERLLEQIDAIRQWNRNRGGEIHLFAGVECDILKDGCLDYPDEILQQLDYVVASVHSSFSLDEKIQTRRICEAMENPNITMLGHATGRLLLEREPYAVNIQDVIKTAASTGTWIELNASPYRLDMDWRHWKSARDAGVKCVINPDAHRVHQLGYLKPAVAIARKGWLRKQDVMNCHTLKQIQRALREKSANAR